MRIALLSAARAIDNGVQGGTSAYVDALAAALGRLGNEVHVFTVEPARRSEYRRLGDLHYHIVASSQGPRMMSTVADAALYYLRETEGVAGTFDVVHAHHRVLLPVLDEVRSSRFTKALLTLHSGAGLPNRNGGARDLSWGIVASLDGLAATSRALRDKISERLNIDPTLVQITYPGIDQQRYSRWVDQAKAKQRIGIGSEDPLILFVGELTRSLGPDLLIEAIFDVVPIAPSAKVVFAGDGHLRPYLQERAKVLGIFASTRFLGFLPETDLIELYNACDIVCVPTRGGRADRAVLEAWCAGKPVIVCQQGAPEFLEANINGLVIDAEPTALARTLVFCLGARDTAIGLGRRGWEKVNNELSWAAIARRHQEIYQRN